MPFNPSWTLETSTRAEVDALSGPTLIEFGAEWCPHCQAAQSALETALANAPDVRHMKIEDGKGRPLGRSFGVKLWPNFVLMRDGKVSEQLARPDTASLVAAIERLEKA